MAGIDRLTTLAFSVYSNKGAYALLLGSGISRAAHIPSAWEVESELIARFAATKEVEGVKDWHLWYKNEYGKEADYSSLLDELTSTKTERVGLMRGFFEPSDEDKEMGWKAPTEAHRSIAKLAKNGYVRIILTTNFDRLIEEALSAEGVPFQVVLHESDLEKITPIVHSSIPTIVKINGDYIDCRFRNTTSELEDYPEDLKRFLSRVFEDYGLLTCGWSATWDVGLVSIIKGATASRYNAFMSYVGKASDELIALAEARNGETLKTDGADILFKNLYEQVDALEQNAISKHLSKDIVLLRLKKYIQSKQYAIEYADMIEGLGQEAYDKIQAIADYSSPLTADSFNFFFQRHREAVSTLLDVATVVGRWGSPAQIKMLGEVVVKLCLRPYRSGMSTCRNANYQHGIAATLLLNTLGITCVHYENFKGLNAVLRMNVPAENFVTTLYRKELLYVVGDSHLGRDTLNALIGQRYYYPYSILLLNELRGEFEQMFPLEDDYETAFYIWEHLKSLIYGYQKCYFMDHFSVPIGHFTRYEAEQRFRQSAETVYCHFFDSADQLKNEWPPIKQGMFGGKYENYKEIYDQAVEYYKNNRIAG